MITHNDCLKKYGEPLPENEGKFMVIYDWNWEQYIPALPKRVYINKDLKAPINNAFDNVVKRGFANEIKTWDGCFNPRLKRGAHTPSLHSWGVAIDINAAWNGFGKQPTMSSGLVACFVDAGFDWGGTWKKPDGMHFQLREI